MRTFEKNGVPPGSDGPSRRSLVRPSAPRDAGAAPGTGLAAACRRSPCGASPTRRAPYDSAVVPGSTVTEWAVERRRPVGAAVGRLERRDHARLTLRLEGVRRGGRAVIERRPWRPRVPSARNVTVPVASAGCTVAVSVASSPTVAVSGPVTSIEVDPGSTDDVRPAESGGRGVRGGVRGGEGRPHRRDTHARERVRQRRRAQRRPAPAAPTGAPFTLNCDRPGSAVAGVTEAESVVGMSTVADSGPVTVVVVASRLRRHSVMPVEPADPAYAKRSVGREGRPEPSWRRRSRTCATSTPHPPSPAPANPPATRPH